VGAYAVAVHGFKRATKGIDFFVWWAPENASSSMRALSKFGAPLEQISEADFSSEGIVFRIGQSPRRIDIITSASGIDFGTAYANRHTVLLEGLGVPVISLRDLIVNKRAGGRAQDLADLEKSISAQEQKLT
jgi:hypothetical protein